MKEIDFKRLAANFDKVQAGEEPHATNLSYRLEVHALKIRLLGGLAGLSGVAYAVHHFL